MYNVRVWEKVRVSGIIRVQEKVRVLRSDKQWKLKFGKMFKYWK